MSARRFMPAIICGFILLGGCGDDPASPGKSGNNGTTITGDVTIPPNQDNTLIEDALGDRSNGAGEFMFAGRTDQGSESVRRALVRFAVADSIPAGSTIDSVFLELNMSKSPTATARNVSLHKVIASWGEAGSDADGGSGPGSGGADGAPAQAGDATWLHTSYDTGLWAGAGGDFVAGASATLGVAGVGKYLWGSTAAMVADLQDWLDNPGANFGWLLIGDESTTKTAKRFDTRENATAANRPKLIVYYTEP